MSKYFSINGYWIDDNTEFNNYIVKSNHDVDFVGDDVFYYGLSEQDIKSAIKNKTIIIDEFIITSYEPLKRN